MQGNCLFLFVLNGEKTELGKSIVFAPRTQKLSFHMWECFWAFTPPYLFFYCSALTFHWNVLMPMSKRIIGLPQRDLSSEETQVEIWLA